MKNLFGLTIILVCVACTGMYGTQPSHPDGTFKVVDARVWDSDFVPGWVIKPAEAQFKIPAIIRFNHPVSKKTMVSGLTFDLSLNGAKAKGSFQFSSDGRTAVFYSDETAGNVSPLDAGANFTICMTIRGRSGTIVDAQGAVWPFSGVHSEPENDPNMSPFTLGALLDGDSDEQAGGDYENCWTIVG